MSRLFALLAVLVLTVPAQAQPAPAVDYARFLDMRFLPQRGQFMFGSPTSDFLLFPPADLDPYEVDGAYIVRDDEGNVLGRQALGTMQQTASAAFLKVGTRSGPTWSGTLQDGGSYALDLVLEGEAVGSILFTVSVSDSGDPFDPKTIFSVDGPWRTHAYFQHEAERPDYIMHFNAWVAADDMATNSPSEVSIRRDGQEVAWGAAFVDLRHGWGRAEYRLFTPESRHDTFGRHKANPASFTIQDVTPGTYEIILSSADGAFRTFTVEAGQGTFPAHARSDVNYTPRADFLTPRRMGGSNLNKPLSVYWVVSE